MKPASFAALVVAATTTATAVNADGYTPAEPEPEVVVVAPEYADFSGFFGGVTLSHNSGNFSDTIFPGDGSGELDGNGAGVLLGYNGQNGRLVYGVELSYAGTDIHGAETCFNPIFDCGFDVNSVGSLRGRVGYVAAPRTMVFGTVGVARADVRAYTDDGVTRYADSKTLDGMVYGIGVEHRLRERVNLRAAVVHHDFDGDDFQTDVVYDDLKTDFTSIELGVTLRF